MSVFRTLLCDWLGWHRVSKAYFYGVFNTKGTCDRCGRECMQDSTGAWFEIQ